MSSPRLPGGRDGLPPVLPVFAVSGAILLPGTAIPLMVFEPRYLALVDDCLGAGRLFGLVQPCDESHGRVAGLRDTGTLARLTAFGETGDGRYLVTATGLTRFHLLDETEGRQGYRRVVVDYRPFQADLDQRDDGPVERKPLLAILRHYLARLGLGLDLADLEKAGDGDLVSRLAMACPFSPDEKQALLESASHAERCRLMTAIIQRDLLADDVSTSIH